MTMITPSYLGETIEYSSLHACRSTLEDPTWRCLVLEYEFRLHIQLERCFFGVTSHVIQSCALGGQ